MRKNNPLKTINALPPRDYKGYQSAWCKTLRKMKLWNGRKYHGDILLTLDEWNTVLAEAERVSRETI